MSALRHKAALTSPRSFSPQLVHCGRAAASIGKISGGAAGSAGKSCRVPIALGALTVRPDDFMLRGAPTFVSRVRVSLYDHTFKWGLNYKFY